MPRRTSNIARRIVDSRTPGYDQVGTVWLPLPHWLMLPFVRVRRAVGEAAWPAPSPSRDRFVLAGTFLYAAARRVFDCDRRRAGRRRAVRAQSQRALPAVHPHDGEPLRPPVCWRCCISRCVFAIRRDGARCRAPASPPARPRLTRYEGWFLLPFAAVYFCSPPRGNRMPWRVVFSVLAGLGPLFWSLSQLVAHGRPAGLLSGPYSARAIQGSADYPGKKRLA